MPDFIQHAKSPRTLARLLAPCLVAIGCEQTSNTTETVPAPVAQRQPSNENQSTVIQSGTSSGPLDVTLTSDDTPLPLHSPVAGLDSSHSLTNPSDTETLTTEPPKTNALATSADKPVTSPAFDFEPPFPARPNPFARPDRDSQAAVQPNNDAQDGDVVLQGFANVGQPRAILQINGEVVTLAKGQTKHGIFVMEIAPPEVTLRRGRFVWTTLLQRPESKPRRR